MIKARIIGHMKPDIIVCLRGKYNLYFIKDIDRYKDLKVLDNIYFDSWYFSCDIRELERIIN